MPTQIQILGAKVQPDHQQQPSSLPIQTPISQPSQNTSKKTQPLVQPTPPTSNTQQVISDLYKDWPVLPKPDQFPSPTPAIASSPNPQVPPQPPVPISVTTSSPNPQSSTQVPAPISTIPSPTPSLSAIQMPLLKTSTRKVDFGTIDHKTKSEQTIHVSNVGDGILQIEIKNKPGWLSITPTKLVCAKNETKPISISLESELVPNTLLIPQNQTTDNIDFEVYDLKSKDVILIDSNGGNTTVDLTAILWFPVKIEPLTPITEKSQQEKVIAKDFAKQNRQISKLVISFLIMGTLLYGCIYLFGIFKPFNTFAVNNTNSSAITVISTETPTPTASKTPVPKPSFTYTPTAPPTATSTVMPTLTSTPTAFPEPTEISSVDENMNPIDTSCENLVGTLTLLDPVNKTIVNEAIFRWHWDGELPATCGFEISLWREGQSPQGIHDAILDNETGRIQKSGEGIYQLTVQGLQYAPSVSGVEGNYFWTVTIIQIAPEYRTTAIQAEPAKFFINLIK